MPGTDAIAFPNALTFDWSAAIHLRDAARAEMLWMCGEPDLGEERVEL